MFAKERIIKYRTTGDNMRFGRFGRFGRFRRFGRLRPFVGHTQIDTVEHRGGMSIPFELCCFSIHLAQTKKNDHPEDKVKTEKSKPKRIRTAINQMMLPEDFCFACWNRSIRRGG